MVIKCKTTGIRLCESNVLGERHKKLINGFNIKEIKKDVTVEEDDILGYVLNIFYDKKSDLGFILISYKTFDDNNYTKTLYERLERIRLNEFYDILSEYNKFIVKK